MRKENGITLVALVITIIILLILVGVTINLTLGERGIFRIAQKAAKNYRDSQQEEMYGLNSLQNEINDTIGNLGNSSIIANVAVTLNKTSSTIKVGESETLTATINSTNLEDTTITWSSSDSNVATVTNGVVTGVGFGTATITARTASGIEDSCVVNVDHPTDLAVGQIVVVKEVPFYVMKASGASETNVTLLRKELYGSYDWSAACTEGTNYASSLGYTSDQATSHLITKEEAEALSSLMRTTGSNYWTSSAYDSISSWSVHDNGSFNLDNFARNAYGARPVLVILKTLI